MVVTLNTNNVLEDCLDQASLLGDAEPRLNVFNTHLAGSFSVSGGREPPRTTTTFRSKGTCKNRDDSKGKCYFYGGSDCLTNCQLQTGDER